MDKEIKNNYNDALFNLEQVLQSMKITEQQQELLTKSLAAFGEAFDNIISWINILDKYASRLDSLGETDFHVGTKTIEERLNIIEGSLGIFAMSHKGHTSYSEVEFNEMHGDSYKRLDGIQKKVDRIVKLLDNAKIELSFQGALKL